jgi:hypothetical protein
MLWQTLNEEVPKVEQGGDCKNLLALMLLLRHCVVLVSWVGHELVRNRGALRSLLACIPSSFERGVTSDERVASSASAIFVLSVSIASVGQEEHKTAVRTDRHPPSHTYRFSMRVIHNRQIGNVGPDDC